MTQHVNRYVFDVSSHSVCRASHSLLICASIKSVGHTAVLYQLFINDLLCHTHFLIYILSMPTIRDVQDISLISTVVV